MSRDSFVFPLGMMVFFPPFCVTRDHDKMAPLYVFIESGLYPKERPAVFSVVNTN
jgi:hypothetical protein